MTNNEGSSADLLLHLEFCAKKWNVSPWYEQDEGVVDTRPRYSTKFHSIQLPYNIFFRLQDAYHAISNALDRLGVDPNCQHYCIGYTVGKAQRLCVKNMSNADHREKYILCNLVISYDGLVDERLVSVDESQESSLPSMEDQDQGMVSDDESQESMEDEYDGMVPAALPAIRSLGASRIKVEDGKNVQQCMVCQEEYCNGEKVTCMPCLHMFHTDCITKWLLRSHLCPICKFEMPKYST